MRYIIFVIDDLSISATGNEIETINEFNSNLIHNGNFILAAGITSPNQAQVIDNRRGLNLVTIGSLFDSIDFYSGFWIIEAKTLDEAVDLAKAGSEACNRRVELRAFLS